MTHSSWQRRREPASHADDWLMTYADMITLLLCFFAVFLLVSGAKKTVLGPAPAPPVAEATQQIPLPAEQLQIQPSQIQLPAELPEMFQRNLSFDDGEEVGAAAEDTEDSLPTEFDEKPLPANQTPAVAGVAADTAPAQTDAPPPQARVSPAVAEPSPLEADAVPPKGDATAVAADIAAVNAAAPPAIDTPPVAPAPIVDTSNAPGTADIEHKGDRITTLEMSSAAFFDSGSASLSEAGKSILQDVAVKLEADLAKGYRITVEGHTDDTPIHTAQFPSNWELSTARASSVVHFLLDQGIPAEKLRAAGYADTFPKRPNRDANGNAIPENQAQNRRVVIRLEKIEKAER